MFLRKLDCGLVCQIQSPLGDGVLKIKAEFAFSTRTNTAQLSLYKDLD